VSVFQLVLSLCSIIPWEVPVSVGQNRHLAANLSREKCRPHYASSPPWAGVFFFSPLYFLGQVLYTPGFSLTIDLPASAS
jgi:hypothetical protein